jgi:hypothetical protein
VAADSDSGTETQTAVTGLRLTLVDLGSIAERGIGQKWELTLLVLLVSLSALHLLPPHVSPSLPFPFVLSSDSSASVRRLQTLGERRDKVNALDKSARSNPEPSFVLVAPLFLRPPSS